MVSYMQVPSKKIEGELFYREEREVERGLQQAYGHSLAELWLSLHQLRSCKQEKGVFLLPVGLCYCHRVWELPFPSPCLYLIKVSVHFLVSQMAQQVKNPPAMQESQETQI